MISLITTVRNESSSIRDWLDGISTQARKPDEIVIVDGGSTDGTLELLVDASNSEGIPIKVILESGANISRGRNVAIESARGDIIVATDAGCKLDPHWLEFLVDPVEKLKAHVASGFFLPDAQSRFERYLAAVTIPILSEINPETFLPSSRSVAFQKAAWEDIDGYPEWLPICEDLVFDMKLKKAKYRFKFQPDALVSWRPRTTVRKFFKQYYLYARGDGHAKLWLKRHIIRYVTYTALIVGLVLSIRYAWVLLLLLVAGLLYSFKFYRRFWSHYPNVEWREKIQAIFVIPALVMMGDVAKMIGYPVGVWQRVTGKVQFHAY